MKHRILCRWPHESWEVQEEVNNNGKTDWMTIHHCEGKGDEGYKEAKKWLKDNNK